MASKYGTRSRKAALSNLKAVNSPSSPTTLSSKSCPEDSHSSPTSSSQSNQQHSEKLPSVAKISKENVTVTVRFRPLSPREIRQGEEVAWYADGETIVRNEHNSSVAYAYDRVFGPTTTTRHVYDISAQHAVNGAMEGINGTIFAYGVTSSGKTHTMHGNQRSPGIIPLSVKDAFSIIQETPTREFLLRVSYLEIYNEVVNDLLNPAGQNLRIREDSQGTFVEGLKEEVVLSPAHALSLIAAGEEHRHVGSTNFNLVSSRSHTIFTLTIESSPCGECCGRETVNLSQLNLIDLAGSESSKAETTGMRRKEGSYINKSLLTLGTVISKLTDERATHIPYRDSKLTRLLQSSLSGHGRVSLICTITPSSSNSEETQNTLKFAHRAKHIEIQTAQNKIIDEKSLIKKYQNEIRILKEELEHLKKGIVTIPQQKDIAEDDLVLLKQKLEDGNVLLQSRVEQEEDAKASLLGRIQRLTKLILVSTKTSASTRFPYNNGPRRRHSFGEEELVYLPYKKRDLVLENENIDICDSFEGSTDSADDSLKEKKPRKHGLLNWLKPRKRDSKMGPLSNNIDKSSLIHTSSIPSASIAESFNFHTESRLSNSLLAEGSPSVDLLSESELGNEAIEDSGLGPETPLTSLNAMDQIDQLREQKKILFGEVALHTSAIKRLSEEATRSPSAGNTHEELRKLKDEIKEKNDQIALVEKQIANFILTSHHKMNKLEISSSISELLEQLNEKSFEHEVKVADNRIIQEQLNQKISECESLQETVLSLEQQLSDALEFKKTVPEISQSHDLSEAIGFVVESLLDEKDVSNDLTEGLFPHEQAREMAGAAARMQELMDRNKELEFQNRKLAEESGYAKGLASAAAVELKTLSEEVAKLMNHNRRLCSESAALKNFPQHPQGGGRAGSGGRRRESLGKRREEKEDDLKREVEELRWRESDLQNQLADMRILVADLHENARDDRASSSDQVLHRRAF